MENLLVNKPTSSPAIHVNNFDFLRLLFASLVLVTHSYPLTGVPEEDPMFHFSHGETQFSGLAVHGFFILSGYLIAISLTRSKGIADYFFKRIIRVFPALWAVAISTILICSIISTKSFAEYYTDSSTYTYLLTAILRIQPFISGVFDSNPLKYVNGSLWTVPYEFLLYILLSPLFIIRNHPKLCRLIIGTAFIILFLCIRYAHITGNFLGLEISNIIIFGLLFISGSFFAYVPLPGKRVKDLINILGVLGLMAILYFSRFYFLGHLLLYPILLISFGTSNYKLLSWVRKYGDISYGIYIWGFFIQQILVYFFHYNQVTLLLICIPCTYIISALSWHLLEKKALRLKNIL